MLLPGVRGRDDLVRESEVYHSFVGLAPPREKFWKVGELWSDSGTSWYVARFGGGRCGCALNEECFCSIIEERGEARLGTG